MPRTRFFPNPYPDYSSGTDFDIPKEKWAETIQSVAKQIMDAVDTTSPDGGLYVGSSGIAYMFYYLSTYEPFAANRNKYLDAARQIFQRDIKYAAKTKSGSDAVSFILGPAGVYALGVFLGKVCNNEDLIKDNLGKYQSLSVYCQKLNFLSCGSDELFVGRSGYLCGMLAIEKCLGVKILNNDTTNNICQAIVLSGQEYAKRHRSSSPLMWAAHGISSILQMVMCCQSYLESNPQEANLIKATVDWLLKLQQKNGNFVPAMDELSQPRPEEEELVHWCHGAPGVVYLFAKAYKIWNQPEYLDACLQCGEITWRKGLLTKGPGICHGVAGSGLQVPAGLAAIFESNKETGAAGRRIIYGQMYQRLRSSGKMRQGQTRVVWPVEIRQLVREVVPSEEGERPAGQYDAQHENNIKNYYITLAEMSEVVWEARLEDTSRPCGGGKAPTKKFCGRRK